MFHGYNDAIQIRGVGRGGAKGAAAPPPPPKKREEKREKGEEKRKKKEKRGIKRERKLNQSFKEHVITGLHISAAPRPPTVMASAFHDSGQPPLSQNPTYPHASRI